MLAGFFYLKRAENETRTRDPNLGKVMPVSYTHLPLPKRHTARHSPSSVRRESSDGESLSQYLCTRLYCCLLYTSTAHTRHYRIDSDRGAQESQKGRTEREKEIPQEEHAGCTAVC